VARAGGRVHAKIDPQRTHDPLFSLYAESAMAGRTGHGRGRWFAVNTCWRSVVPLSFLLNCCANCPIGTWPCHASAQRDPDWSDRDRLCRAVGSGPGGVRRRCGKARLPRFRCDSGVATARQLLDRRGVTGPLYIGATAEALTVLRDERVTSADRNRQEKKEKYKQLCVDWSAIFKTAQVISLPRQEIGSHRQLVVVAACRPA